MIKLQTVGRTEENEKKPFGEAELGEEASRSYVRRNGSEWHATLSS